MPKKDDDNQSGLTEIVTGGMAKLPAWWRAGLIWGPLGVIFSLVCVFMSAIGWDIHQGVREHFATQKAVSADLREAATTFADSAEDVMSIKRDVREVKGMMSAAEEQMAGAPERSEKMLQLLAKQVQLLEIVAAEKKQ